MQPKRNNTKQTEHDKVVTASAATWQNKPGRVVHTNPGGDKNFSVNGDNYPDVVVVDNQNQLLAVEEIETEESVNQNEAEQWEKYSGFGVRLNLVVPESHVSEAQRLTSSISSVIVQGYRIGPGGQVIFS